MMKNTVVIVIFLMATFKIWSQTNLIKVPSELLNEERTVQLGLPASYDPDSNTRYPVLVVLDGEWHFQMVYEATKLLYQNGGPELIVAGIHHPDRGRDLTFTKTKEDPNGGGAGAFLDFLEKELLPHLETTYNISGYQVLLGHSAGGLLAAYTLITRPYLFNSYAAVTPTIRWDDFKLLKAFDKEEQEKIKNSNIHFSMSIGNERGDERKGVILLDSIMESLKSETFKYSFREYQHLSHVTVPWNAYFDSLNEIFSEFYLTDQQLMNSLEFLITYFDKLGTKFDHESRVPQRILLDRGYKLIEDHDFDRSIKNFEYYARIYPDVPLPYSNLGDLYNITGDIKRSVEAFKKAYELYPSEYVRKRLEELASQKDH